MEGCEYRLPVYNEDGTEKHIIKNGARYHVLSWDEKGMYCSEPNCEINKRREENYERI